ncbi:MAG: hypothetical protein LC687_04145 [Actinobacteria bacterium]|nr:hypothetical protein [Actinomycetota bacterium]
MEPSDTLDEITGEAYPDVLTAEYQDFIFTRTPKKAQLNLQDVDKFFLLNARYYNTPQGDDILLDINLVPHISYLTPGLIMYIPAMGDMEAFVKRKTKQERRKL